MRNHNGKEQARSIEEMRIRDKLTKAEKSGFSNRSAEEIINEVIARKQTTGEL
ncbi:MAG: hypothetical protein KJO69_02225 [Gammaproteobacteria bacterium]|nr:hypothetical protein [Gammaproteobacteria bacterium]NNJ72462.1 hypothetical protein [Enterobacterales bacterium]